jgi:hypothetical protein
MTSISPAPNDSATPRCDGFYHARSDAGDSTYTIRFYPDGEVITVCIGGKWDTDLILKWFDRSNPEVSKGPYVVLGEAICLTSICSQGRVDYAGFLHKGVLRISSLSQINGHCSAYLSYDFVPIPALRERTEG